MMETRTVRREQLRSETDEAPSDHLMEQMTQLSPEHYAEAQALDQAYQREWQAINKALRDNSMAVTRAMSRWYSTQGDRELKTAEVIGKFENGSFLLNRLGAEAVIDQDLATVLLHLRNGLIEEYGNGPAALMLIDRAIAAYQALMRIEGWIGNLGILIEHEFFGTEKPSASFKDHYGSEGRRIRGLSIEEHLARLREHLLPMAERCGRALQDARAALQAFTAAPSRLVERSWPVRYSLDIVAALPG